MSSEEIYQDFILEIYKNPINFGKMENADLHAESYNSLCGDKVELFLKVDDEKIKEAKFLGSGCVISQVSASLLTEELKGKTFNEAGMMKKEDILAMIKIDLRKNPSRLKCALLPLETLQKALKS